MAGNSWLGINVRWLCGLIATTIGVVALSNSACAALIAEEPFAIGARNQRSVFKTVNLVKTVKTVKTVNLAHTFSLGSFACNFACSFACKFAGCLCSRSMSSEFVGRNE
jgi:hypothetical protein